MSEPIEELKELFPEQWERLNEFIIDPSYQEFCNYMEVVAMLAETALRESATEEDSHGTM